MTSANAPFIRNAELLIAPLADDEGGGAWSNQVLDGVVPQSEFTLILDTDGAGQQISTQPPQS